MGWVSHLPTLKGFDVLVKLSNQLTYMGQVLTINFLGYVRISGPGLGATPSLEPCIACPGFQTIRTVKPRE